MAVATASVFSQTFIHIPSVSVTQRFTPPCSPQQFVSSLPALSLCLPAVRQQSFAAQLKFSSEGLRASTTVAENVLYNRFLRGEGAAYRSLAAAAASATISGVDGVQGTRRRAGGGAMGAEMNIFARVGRIFRAFIEGVVSSNEDPERLLDQAVLEMGTDLAKLRQTSAQVVAAQRMLQDKCAKARTSGEEWHRRARLALEKGVEALAREALKQRKAFEDSARSLQVQLEQQTGVAERILTSSRALESKIAEARSKKDNLKARAQSAKTSKQIQEMLGSLDSSSALAAYDWMEEKVERLEAEADALTQITADDLTTKFAALEAEDVGDDLEKLKREVGLGGRIRGQIRGELPQWRESVVLERE